jgi:hypothetical protein
MQFFVENAVEEELSDGVEYAQQRNQAKAAVPKYNYVAIRHAMGAMTVP